MLTASCHDSNTIYKQKLRMLYNSYSSNCYITSCHQIKITMIVTKSYVQPVSLFDGWYML